MEEIKAFDEKTLREELVKTWGPAGAHVEVFDDIIKQRDLALHYVNSLLCNGPLAIEGSSTSYWREAYQNAKAFLVKSGVIFCLILLVSSCSSERTEISGLNERAQRTVINPVTKNCMAFSPDNDLCPRLMQKADSVVITPKVTVAYHKGRVLCWVRQDSRYAGWGNKVKQPPSNWPKPEL